MTDINITLIGDRFLIDGELTRMSITPLFEKKSREITNQKLSIVDLSKVKKVDTAGLAWLLLLVEQAKLQPCDLSFEFLPQDLLKLAKLSAVDTFLPINHFS